MAACESDDIPTLRITNEELRKRSKLTSGDRHSEHTTAQYSSPEKKVEKSTPGLLYLSPTTVVNTNNEEKKTKRTRGRTRQEEASRPPKLPTNPTRQERRRSNTVNPSDLSRNGTDRQSHGESVRQKGPSQRTPNHEQRQEKGTEPRSEDELLRAEWSRHENRKIERALAKWQGDVAKLDPIIQAW